MIRAASETFWQIRHASAKGTPRTEAVHFQGHDESVTGLTASAPARALPLRAWRFFHQTRRPVTARSEGKRPERKTRNRPGPSEPHPEMQQMLPVQELLTERIGSQVVDIGDGARNRRPAQRERAVGLGPDPSVPKSTTKFLCRRQFQPRDARWVPQNAPMRWLPPGRSPLGGNIARLGLGRWFPHRADAPARRGRWSEERSDRFRHWPLLGHRQQSREAHQCHDDSHPADKGRPMGGGSER